MIKCRMELDNYTGIRHHEVMSMHYCKLAGFKWVNIPVPEPYSNSEGWSGKISFWKTGYTVPSYMWNY